MSVKFWALALFVLAIGGILAWFKKEGHARSGPLPYELKRSILNKSEFTFYKELSRQLPPGYRVFPQMRLIDLIKITETRDYARWRNKIWAKHIDFVVCDSAMQSVHAIELDGDSHMSAKRAERDAFVNSICEAVQLPLTRVRVSHFYTQEVAKIVASLSA